MGKKCLLQACLRKTWVNVFTVIFASPDKILKEKQTSAQATSIAHETLGMAFSLQKKHDIFLTLH